MNPAGPTTPPPLAPGGHDAPSLPPRERGGDPAGGPGGDERGGEEGGPPTTTLSPRPADGCHNWFRDHEEPGPFEPMSLIGLIVEGMQHQARSASASQEVDRAMQLHYHHHHLHHHQGGTSYRSEDIPGWQSRGRGEEEVRYFANNPPGARRFVPHPLGSLGEGGVRHGHARPWPGSVRPRASALRGVLADTLEVLGGEDASSGLGRQANQ